MIVVDYRKNFCVRSHRVDNDGCLEKGSLFMQSFSSVFFFFLFCLFFIYLSIDFFSPGLRQRAQPYIPPDQVVSGADLQALSVHLPNPTLDGPNSLTSRQTTSPTQPTGQQRV